MNIKLAKTKNNGKGVPHQPSAMSNIDITTNNRDTLLANTRKLYKLNAERSLYEFSRNILGFEDMDPNVHIEWEMFLKGGKRLKLVLIPRGHFKSSFFTISYPLWCLCLDPTQRFLITNAVFDNAKSFLNAVKQQIERNPKIYDWWNLEPGDPWSSEEITVKRDSIHKEPSISVAGIGSQLPSQHYDKILWDDLVNDKNITSKEYANKVIDWWKDSLNVLEPGGLGIMIGTRWSYRDLYQHIIDNFKDEFDIIVKRAIAPDGTIYFPKRFDKEGLDRLRKLEGPYRFSLQYQNELVDPEDAVFKKEWILKYRETPPELKKFMTIDPALSTDIKADYSVIMICGVDPLNRLYVLDYFRDKVEPRDLINKIFSMDLEYNPQTIGIETVAFQRVLSFWMQDQMNERGHYLPLEELRTSNKMKGDRILALQPRFASKSIFIREWMADLEDELISFRYPEGNQLHDDLIDALAYQLEVAYKPHARVEESKFVYLSPAWYENKFAKKVTVSDIYNPHLYKH